MWRRASTHNVSILRFWVLLGLSAAIPPGGIANVPTATHGSPSIEDASANTLQCCVVSETAGQFDDQCVVVATEEDCIAVGGFVAPVTGTCDPNPCPPSPAFACCTSPAPGGPKNECRLLTTGQECAA